MIKVFPILKSYKRKYITARTWYMPILGQGDVHMKAPDAHSRTSKINLTDVAYCREFPWKLVSRDMPKDVG